MKNKEIIKILDELSRLSHDEQWTEVEKYSIEYLELLATTAYDNLQKKYLGPKIRDDHLLTAILIERVSKIDRDFEWTDDNKLKFISVNNRFIQVFESAYNEAVSIANALEDRIKNGDIFIKDYEITIRITPYIEDVFYDQMLDENGIGFVLSEPDLHFDPIECYISRHSFDAVPIYLDKSLNWNIEYFGDTFEKDYICYAIHELLDTHRWSFYDIANIKKIWADVVVKYQNYTEDM